MSVTVDVADRRRAGRAVPRRAVVAAGFAVAGVAGSAGTGDPGWLAAAVAGAVIGLALRSPLRVPNGAQIPAGVAVAVAAAYLLTPAWFALAAAVAAVCGAGPAVAGRRTWSLWLPAALAVTVSVVDAALRGGLWAVDDGGLRDLLPLAGGSLIVFAADSALAARAARRTNLVLPRAGMGAAYVALGCAAALAGLAARHGGPALMLLAAGPLAIMRFSFERYAQAKLTYRETISALSLVPEMAGFVDDGHATRTATLAAAVADQLRLPAVLRDRVIDAARLHHLGSVAPDVADRTGDRLVVSRRTAALLRRSDWLAAAADVVEAAAGPAAVAGATDVSLCAAIVRAADRFDHLSRADRERTNAALAIIRSELSAGEVGPRVVAALEQVLARRPELVAAGP